MCLALSSRLTSLPATSNVCLSATTTAGLSPKLFLKTLGTEVSAPPPDVHVLCVRSLLQGRFDELCAHIIYSPAAGVPLATWRSVLCISSFICGYASM